MLYGYLVEMKFSEWEDYKKGIILNPYQTYHCEIDYEKTYLVFWYRGENDEIEFVRFFKSGDFKYREIPDSEQLVKKRIKIKKLEKIIPRNKEIPKSKCCIFSE